MRPSRNILLYSMAVCCTLLFAIMLFSHKKADVDLWGNLGFVKAPPWSESFHRTNTFSFTEPDHEWTNHEWLAEYILNLAHRTGGNRLLLTVKTLMGLVLAGMLFFCLRRDCKSRPFQFLFLLLVLSTIGYGFSTRPHLFTYIMLASLLLGLRFRPRLLLWAALPAGILWANLHGAFFIGIVVVTAYLAGLLASDPKESKNQVIELGAAIALFILASLANPYGAGIWSFISESAAKSRTYLSEWAPFHPVRDIADHTDFAALVILCAFAMTGRKRPALPWLAVGTLAFLAAVFMRRNIPLFAIVSVFTFAPLADQRFGKHLDRFLEKRSYWLKAAALSAMVAACALGLWRTHRENPFEIEVDTSRFPVGCMEFIKDNRLNGNLLAFFDWAEYCIWELYPETRVFLDGRYKSAYSSEVIDTFFDFVYAGPEWDRALTDHPTTMVLVHKGNPVYTRMLEREGWVLACTDSISGLFLKEDNFESYIRGLAPLPIEKEPEEIVLFK